MVKEILLLGNPALYEKSAEISINELKDLNPVIDNLYDTLMDFRDKYGAGRAIAAPQIGIQKRLIYMFTDKPAIFINPRLSFPTNEKIKILDDCMSFPHLLVKVERYKQCRIDFWDLNGNPQSVLYTDDLSELIQHEFDHLDGILATMRAMDKFSFYAK